MAYINRLSDINNKLDTNIENQEVTNTKLSNIDDNIETIRTSFDPTTSALKVNIVAGGVSGSSSSDGKAYLYNGAGNTPITATTITATKNGIDTASSMFVSDGTTRTALTATAITDTKNGIDTASALYVSDGTTTTALTSTAVTATKNGIDTASSMFVSDGTTRTALTATAITATKNGIDTASSMFVSDGTTRTALTSTEINNLLGSSSKCMDTASSIYGINATSRYKIGATNVDDGNTFYGLNTASSMYVSSGMGNRTALTATSNALDVNIKSQSTNYLGDFGNILNGIPINANSNSSSINITGYSSNSLISYSDTQNLTDTILIFGSLNNSNFFHIGSLLPIYNISLAARYASTKINLAPIKYIRIYNTSSTNITTATCTVVSG